MRNLFVLNFKTLKRDLCLKIILGLLAVALVMNFEYLFSYSCYSDGYDPYWMPFADIELFSYCGGYLVFISAVFSSFYIGKGYRHNTLRNKVTRGLRRESIYLSNLITVFIVCTVIVAVYMVVVYLMAISLKFGFAFSRAEILKGFIYSLLPLLSLCCIFTAISMNIKNEVISLVVCFAVVAVMYFVWFEVDWAISLDGPTYYYGITEAEIKAYEFLEDFLPVSQLETINNRFYCEFDSMYEPIYQGSPISPRIIPMSLALSVASSLAGILIFKKKNIN
ncbi:MAG: ABC transporter permease subunit [Clostridia bacterium]|nr:ABC transporter permease subunit [Clostridia bacterium]